MEYITFMRTNTTSTIPREAWDAYFLFLSTCDGFKGGSAIKHTHLIGEDGIDPVSPQLGGFMRFSLDDISALKSVLSEHPVIQHGGSIEICEMPEQ